MTTVLAKLTRSGGGYLWLDAVAPGPSGGMYVVGNDNSGDVVTARLNSDGSLNWAKDITIPTLTPSKCAAASSSNRLAIAVMSGGHYSHKTCIVMLDSTGTLVWESVINGFSAVQAEGLLVGSDNSVYVCGVFDGPQTNPNLDMAMLKLNPTTGAITWQVNLTQTSSLCNFSDELQKISSMCQMSGGDIVVALWGSSSTSDGHGYVQRVSSSDGSIVWTVNVNNNSGASSGLYPSNIHIGIDGSDNVYCVGKAFDYGTGYVDLPVVKLNSSGTLVWDRRVRKSGAYTPVFDEVFGGLTADATGVYIAGNMIAGTYGHLMVPAAGTVAAGTVPLSHYTPVNYYYSNIVRCPQVGGSALFAYVDSDITGTDFYFYVVQSPAGSGDDGTYGSTPRTTINFDVFSGISTVSAPASGGTRPSAPTLTLASDLGATVGTGTLSSSVVPPALICAASSLGPTAQFGPDAYLRGLTVTSAPSTQIGGNIIVSRSFPNVGIAAPSTTFGTAVSQRQQRPTALGPTANFGTPAYEPNTTRAADTLGVVLAGIGVPFAILGIAPQPPGYASSVEPTTTFGTPAARHGISLAATGTLVTQFGTASARYTLAASGLEPGAQFGTAKVTMSRAAAGFRATQLGTPVVGLYGLPAGFLRTQFGTPSTLAPITCEATGFLVTNIGSGAAGGAWNLRTRSAYFRTRFGTPQAERTAP